MKKTDFSVRGTVRAARRPLVLYVEDNDDNWSVAEMRLSRTYELVRAKNDQDACEVFKARGPELYVILMDIELQGSKLDGLSLVRLIRGRLPDFRKPAYAAGVPVLSTPVIYVTAYHQTMTPELLETGGNSVVPKPVEFMRLIRELTTMHLKAVAGADFSAGRRPA